MIGPIHGVPARASWKAILDRSRPCEDEAWPRMFCRLDGALGADVRLMTILKIIPIMASRIQHMDIQVNNDVAVAFGNPVFLSWM